MELQYFKLKSPILSTLFIFGFLFQILPSEAQCWEYLTSIDIDSSRLFGHSVSMDGNFAVIGASGEKPNSRGAAYVMELKNNNWEIIARLTASDGSDYDYFGDSVGISNDIIIISSPNHNISTNSNQGAVYVFEKPADGWKDMTETAKLTASDGDHYQMFGIAISIFENTILVGSRQQKAYIFEKPTNGWNNMTETAQLTASEGSTNDSFGETVAVFRHTAIVGAYTGNNRKGEVYVYEKPIEGWTNMIQTAKLTASDIEPYDKFGISLSIKDDIIAIGATFHDNPYPASGAVYLFEKPSEGWKDTNFQKAKLSPSDSQNFYSFGNSISIQDDFVIVGSYTYGSDGYYNIGNGAAYVFSKPTDGWSDLAKPADIFAFDGEKADYFGYSVSSSGNHLLVGAPFYGSDNVGKVYIYSINNSPVLRNKIPDLYVTVVDSLSKNIGGNTFRCDESIELNYTATLENGNNLPEWMLFDKDQLKIIGKPQPSDRGSYKIKIDAKDINNFIVSDTFSINVTNSTPIIKTPIPVQNITIEEVFLLTFDKNTFFDPDGDSLIFNATLTDSLALPGWLSFDSEALTFSGTPTNTDVDTLLIYVTADDLNGGVAIDTFELKVMPKPNNTPIIKTPIPDQSIIVEEAFFFTLDKNTFFDADGDSLIFNAALTDSLGLPDWLSFDSEARTFSGTPTNADTLLIYVTAADLNGDVTIDTFELKVMPKPNNTPIIKTPIPDQNITIEEAFLLTFDKNTFFDADGDSLIFNAALTDSLALPDWLSFDSEACTFSGTPTNTDVDTLLIYVTADDLNGGVAIDTFELSIYPKSNTTPIIKTPIPGQSITVEEAFFFTLDKNTFFDADGDSLIFNAALTDSLALPDWLSFDSEARTFSGTPTNTDTLLIYVSVDDLNGGVAIDTFELSVNPKPITTYKINGTLITQNGELVNNGTVEVYQITNDSITLLKSISLTDSNTFEIEGEEDRWIILKAIPDSEKYANLITTYFGDELLFSEAEVIELSENKPVTINLFEKPEKQTGNSSLEGLALETEGNEGGRLSQGFANEGTPIPNLPVYLLNKEKALVDLDTTDSNGLFKFENINSGEYQLAADYNNKPLSVSNSLFEITENGQSLQLSLLVGDSLSVEITSITGLEDFEPIEGVTIYPNPVENVIQVNIQNQINGNYELEILDITGKSLIKQRLKKSNQNMVESIDLAELTKGIYFLKIRKGNTLVVKRLMKG